MDSLSPQLGPAVSHSKDTGQQKSDLSVEPAKKTDRPLYPTGELIRIGKRRPAAVHRATFLALPIQPALLNWASETYTCTKDGRMAEATHQCPEKATLTLAELHRDPQTPASSAPTSLASSSKRKQRRVGEKYELTMPAPAMQAVFLRTSQPYPTREKSGRCFFSRTGRGTQRATHALAACGHTLSGEPASVTSRPGRSTVAGTRNKLILLARLSRRAPPDTFTYLAAAML